MFEGSGRLKRASQEVAAFLTWAVSGEGGAADAPRDRGMSRNCGVPVLQGPERLLCGVEA